MGGGLKKGARGGLKKVTWVGEKRDGGGQQRKDE